MYSHILSTLLLGSLVGQNCDWPNILAICIWRTAADGCWKSVLRRWCWFGHQQIHVIQEFGQAVNDSTIQSHCMALHDIASLRVPLQLAASGSLQLVFVTSLWPPKAHCSAMCFQVLRCPHRQRASTTGILWLLGCGCELLWYLVPV